MLAWHGGVLDSASRTENNERKEGVRQEQAQILVATKDKVYGIHKNSLEKPLKKTTSELLPTLTVHVTAAPAPPPVRGRDLPSSECSALSKQL